MVIRDGQSDGSRLVARSERYSSADHLEAFRRGDQGPSNDNDQMMAAIPANYIGKLLAGSCRRMASYLDLDDGILRCVPADPEIVAEMYGLHVNALTLRRGAT